MNIRICIRTDNYDTDTIAFEKDTLKIYYRPTQVSGASITAAPQTLQARMGPNLFRRSTWSIKYIIVEQNSSTWNLVFLDFLMHSNLLCSMDTPPKSNKYKIYSIYSMPSIGWGGCDASLGVGNLSVRTFHFGADAPVTACMRLLKNCSLRMLAEWTIGIYMSMAPASDGWALVISLQS